MRRALTLAGVVALVALSAPAVADVAPPLEQRVTNLLAKMTPQEEQTLLEGIDAPAGDHEVGYVAGIPRLGIPPLRLTDGPAGVRDGQPATGLAAPVALAASFDRGLARDAGSLIGLETKARGDQVVYGPMVNIVRIPQGGRNFETYGEDPYLAGQLASQHIQGIQSQRVAAQVKHYALNNQENDRQSSSSNADERTVNEMYLPAFESAVHDGQAWSAMCAYNKVGGNWACENFPLLHDVLHNRWGFDGVVGSDYPATHSTVNSALAGLDQEFGGSTYYSSLADAVAKGQVPRSVLDDRARRVLRLMFRTGVFDGGTLPTADPVAGAALARREAAAGTVLLKNDTGVLPLSTTNTHSVAVIGPYGDQAYTGGGGSSHVTTYPQQTVSPTAGLRARGLTVSYTSGASLQPPAVPASALSNLSVQFFNNTTMSGPPVLTRNDTTIDNDWKGNSPAAGVNATNWSARWTGTLTAPATGDYQLASTSDDGSRVYLDGALVVDNWGDHASRTVTGAVHLDAGSSHQLRVEYYQGGGLSNLTLGWLVPGSSDPGIAQAVAAAKAADVAVVVVGDEESEGSDRSSIDLPGNQNQLVSAVVAANPRTVVVLNTGSAVTMPWLASTHALVEAWYPGEQDGNALADVLLGDVNPSGRLPVTFPTSLSATPIKTAAQYPGVNGVLTYTEGLQVGYRWYDATGTAPLFSFGYGLSYTSFSYSGLSVTGPDSNGNATVSFDLTNTGSRAGTEIPQLYLGYPASVGEPPRVLRGFTNVRLAAGQTQRVSFSLDRQAMATWDSSAHQFHVTTGSYPIAVGASSRDLRLTSSVSVTSPTSIPNGATGQIRGNGGICVDVASANDASGTAVQSYQCNGTPAQTWTLSSDGTIRALNKCLDAGSGVAHIADCAGQAWTKPGDGTLRSNGKCLVSGTPLTLASCNGSPSQVWSLPRPSGQITGASGKCVDTANGSTANGTPVQLYACNGTGAQDWTPASDGTLQALGKCLDLGGTAVRLWDCNGTAAQQWSPRAGGTLVNPQSGRCLGDTGTGLDIRACDGSPAQKWHLP